MDIAELTPASRDVTVSGRITDLTIPHAVNSKHGQKRISFAQLADDSGEIQVTLWEEQIDAVQEGVTVRVEGAYTRDWVGDLQLNIPRSGSIQVTE